MSGGAPSSPRKRILTVCKGDHCRAPLAAAVLAKHGGGAVDVRSAGIRDWHVGRPAHPVMVEVAARHGYELGGHRGTQVGPELLGWADVVLAMDSAVLDSLRELAYRARAFGSTGPEMRLYLDGCDVPDPWGGDEAGFVACVGAVEGGSGEHLGGRR